MKYNVNNLKKVSKYFLKMHFFKIFLFLSHTLLKDLCHTLLIVMFIVLQNILLLKPISKKKSNDNKIKTVYRK